MTWWKHLFYDLSLYYGFLHITETVKRRQSYNFTCIECFTKIFILYILITDREVLLSLLFQVGNFPERDPFDEEEIWSIMVYTKHFSCTTDMLLKFSCVLFFSSSFLHWFLITAWINSSCCPFIWCSLEVNNLMLCIYISFNFILMASDEFSWIQYPACNNSPSNLHIFTFVTFFSFLV